MRGFPLYNYQAFEDGMRHLERLGHEVVSPHNIDIERGWVDASWHTEGSRVVFDRVDLTSERFPMELALAYDIDFICNDAEGVSFLPGWTKSSGARAEYAAAVAVGKPVFLHVAKGGDLVQVA